MTLRLGIVATEFSPNVGGMEQHAANLVGYAAQKHAVTLVTWPTGVMADREVRHLPAWSGDDQADATLVRGTSVDAWLVLNSGWSLTVARGAGAVPMFSYVHGNDLLSPWAPTLPASLAFFARVERRLELAKFQPSAWAAQSWRRHRAITGLRRARLVIANSEHTRQRAVALCRLPDERARVVAPGIADRHFQTEMAQPSAGLLRILTVSRLSSINRRKNIDGLLAGLALLAPAIRWTLTVVGQGDDLPRLAQAATNSGLGHRVRFVGRLDDAALEAAYRKADVFALIPRDDPKDIEGFGMVYAEAAARGVPVIANNVGGIPDAVVDGVTGLFAANASPPAIAEAFVRFLEARVMFDPARIRRCAEAHRASRTSERLLGLIETHLASA